MSDRVTIYQDRAGEWRWRRRSENGQTVSGSEEGYVDRSECYSMAVELNGDAVTYVYGGGDDAA